MSIEKDIERIANGVEAILAKLNGVNQVYETLPATPLAPTSAPVEPVPAIVEPTEEELRNAIRAYMNTNGKEKAIALLIKYGSKAEKPMIKDVTNKTALMAEIKG